MPVQKIEKWIASRPHDLRTLTDKKKLLDEYMKAEIYIEEIDKRIKPFISSERRRYIESGLGLGVTVAGGFLAGPIGYSSRLHIVGNYTNNASS